MGRYLGILAGLLSVLLLTGLGAVLAWPWLLAENYRLTNTELALTWLAEGAALLWFLYFAIRFALTSELESAFSESVSASHAGQWMALAVALAAIVDLGATFVYKAQDAKRRQAAEHGICRVAEVKKYSVEEVRGETSRALVFTAFAWCDLIDQEGLEHPVYYYGRWSRYPEDVREAILRNRLPAEMAVLYDPQFPRRFWVPIAADDRWDGWRFSQEITVFALVFSLLVLIVNQVVFQTSLPLEICPLLGIMLRLLLAGLDMWAKGQTALPPF